MSSFEVIRNAAERGDANAQYKLAMMYLGKVPGVQQNRQIGMDLLRKAGAQGHHKAREELWGYVKHMDKMREQANLSPIRPPSPPEWWVPLGLCQHCGGELKGIFRKRCIVCRKPN